MKCPHYIASSGACNAPELREKPVTWCWSRLDCQTKNDLRPVHLHNLGAYAGGKDQYGVRVYLAHVAMNEGRPSADVLHQVFKSQEALSGR